MQRFVQVFQGSLVVNMMTLRWGMPRKCGFSTRSLGWVFLLGLVGAASGFGQIVTGAGYTLPAPINVAPGQILTVYVQGMGSALTGSVHATGNTLPASLAGLSGTLQQGSNRTL